MAKTWFITAASRGFGAPIAEQALETHAAEIGRSDARLPETKGT